MSGKIYCWGILLSSIVFLGSLNANSDIVDHQNFVDQLNRVLKEELGNREVDSPYAKTIELSLGQKSNFNKQSLEILIDSVLKESDLPVEAGSRMKWVIQLFKSANHQIALRFSGQINSPSLPILQAVYDERIRGNSPIKNRSIRRAAHELEVMDDDFEISEFWTSLVNAQSLLLSCRNLSRGSREIIGNTHLQLNENTHEGQYLTASLDFAKLAQKMNIEPFSFKGQELKELNIMITKGAIKFDVESHWSLPNREIEDFFRYVKLNLENYLLTDAIGLKKRNKLIESTTEEILEWIDDLANFLNEKKSNNNLERLLRTLQNDFRSNSY